MDFFEEKASFFVPGGEPLEQALTKTSHLAIVAHQDDTEILAYSGIAECFADKNKAFSSVIVSNGAGSPRSGIYADYTDEEMQIFRRDEQNKAAMIGAYAAQIQLAYASKDIKNAANKNTVADIKRIVEVSRPEVIYLHNPADKHDTHVATMLRAIEAIRSLNPECRPKKVYGCEVWRDLDWLMDDEKVVLKTDAYPHLAQALIAVFDSQISGGKRYELATLGRRIANATYFASHETDSCESMNFAMDLTPLIENPELQVRDLVKTHLDRFAADVLSKIDLLGATQ